MKLEGQLFEKKHSFTSLHFSMYRLAKNLESALSTRNFSRTAPALQISLHLPLAHLRQDRRLFALETVDFDLFSFKILKDFLRGPSFQDIFKTYSSEPCLCHTNPLINTHPKPAISPFFSPGLLFVNVLKQSIFRIPILEHLLLICSVRFDEYFESFTQDRTEPTATTAS